VSAQPDLPDIGPAVVLVRPLVQWCCAALFSGASLSEHHLDLLLLLLMSLQKAANNSMTTCFQLVITHHLKRATPYFALFDLRQHVFPRAPLSTPEAATPLKQSTISAQIYKTIDKHDRVCIVPFKVGTGEQQRKKNKATFMQ